MRIAASLGLAVAAQGGDDRLASVDGEPDVVRCGGGADVADVDLKDDVGAARSVTDCESIRQGPLHSRPAIAFASRRLLVSHGRATVELRCLALEADCRGRLSLLRGGTTEAQRAYRIRRGRTAALSLPLTGRPTTVRAVATERDARGAPRAVYARLTRARPRR